MHNTNTTLRNPIRGTTQSSINQLAHIEASIFEAVRDGIRHYVTIAKIDSSEIDAIINGCIERITNNGNQFIDNGRHAYLVKLGIANCIDAILRCSLSSGKLKGSIPQERSMEMNKAIDLRRLSWR